MTTKTIKTLMFASLIAAMVLPFFIMEIAYAESIENVNDKVKVDSLKIPNAERDLKLATGHKLYPGAGWVSAEDISKSPAAIYRDHPDNPGKKTLDLDPQVTLVFHLLKKIP